jgi:hypothetical protein
MPRIGSIQLLGSRRAMFDAAVELEDVRRLIEHSAIKVLQCSSAVPAGAWVWLNDVFFAQRPDVELRVFGHHSTECDLGFASGMTNVRRFAADSLRRAKNVEAIAGMPHLESLSLGIYELEDFGVLDRIPTTMTRLALGSTRSKKPSLASLDRFRSLRVLYLEGHSRSIEVLSELQELEDLTLRSITTRDLKYLAPLRNLWSLDIKLGGMRSFAGIEGKQSIKYLELWQVRELHHIDVVAALPGLQNLFLQSLPHVQMLPALSESKALRRAVIQNLKGLRDFSCLEGAPALEEFALVQGERQTPEQLLPVLRNPTVRRVSAHFGSDRRNREFSRLRTEHGKEAAGPLEPFRYR